MASTLPYATVYPIADCKDMSLAEPGPSGTRHEAVIYIDSDEDTLPSSTLKRKRTVEHEEPPNRLADVLMQVLGIVPDVEIAYARGLIKARAITHAGLDDVVEYVLQQIFEKDYPKQPKTKGKEKAIEREDDMDSEGEIKDTGTNYRSVHWRRQQRIGKAYLKGALQALEQHFGRIPSIIIRTQYFLNDNLYTPAFFALLAQSKAEPKPYQELQQNRPKPKSKPPTNPDSGPSGRKRAKADQALENEDDGAEEFERERSWLDGLLELKRARELATQAQAKAHQAALDAGEGLPCGCCFGDETWDNLVQCSEGHLFCKGCAKQYTEGKLGDQITTIVCMDVSGCQAPFPDSELIRILSAKTLSLYHRLQQAKDLQDAKIDGLENCPYCPYACVIEDEDEKLLRCGNEACGIVTCRKCHRPDHIPRTCQELDADSRLDKRHAVEEAMSEALVRNCPKCAKPFIKEEGCNKITCTNCHTISCYICRKVIKGYEHFEQTMGAQAESGGKSVKCLLWDQSRHEQDVAAARQVAQTRVRAEAEAAGVNLGDNDLNVELAIPRVVQPQQRIPAFGPRAGQYPLNGLEQGRPVFAAAEVVRPQVDEQGHDRWIGEEPIAIRVHVARPDRAARRGRRQLDLVVNISDDEDVELVQGPIAPRRGRNRRHAAGAAKAGRR